MAASILPTRESVAVSPVQTTILNTSAFMVQNDQLIAYIENASTTDDLADSIDMLLPPSDISLFTSTLGNLLNIFCYTTGTGLELYIELGLNNAGGWILAASWAITTSLALEIPGYRFTTPYARVRLVNTGANPAVTLYSVRASSS